MTPATDVRARLALHEILLEILFSNWYAAQRDPVSASDAKAFVNVLAARAASDPEVVAALRTAGAKFFDKVRQRVEGGWEELRGVTAEPPEAA